MFTKVGLTALLIASANAACWSTSQGYPCCSSSSVPVSFTDASGSWGVENNDWCGIPVDEPTVECWAESQGYSCCSEGTSVSFTDAAGSWGIENGDWCGIVTSKPVETCWAEKLGYECCSAGTSVAFTDADGKWGFENNNWCGIVAGAVTSTTTTRRTTTTTVRPTTTKRATYTVVYETDSKLPSGYQNWGYDSTLTFKDGAMVITADPKSYGAVSLKNMKANFVGGGSIRMDIKCENSAEIVVESTDDEDLRSVAIVPAQTDFTTVIYDVTYEGPFDRINIKDRSGKGTPIYVRFIIYSTGPADTFVDPIDTVYVPVTTTRPVVLNPKYTTIFKSVYSMPSDYQNWGWGCNLSFAGGAMIIAPEIGEYGAVSLKRVSGTFNGGSIRFDMKNAGKVNIMVESTANDEAVTIAVINPSDTYVTHIVDVTYDAPFDRINFQDAKGTGDLIYVKNLVHSTGPADNFVDPL